PNLRVLTSKAAIARPTDAPRPVCSVHSATSATVSLLLERRQNRGEGYVAPAALPSMGRKSPAPIAAILFQNRAGHATAGHSRGASLSADPLGRAIRPTRSAIVAATTAGERAILSPRWRRPQRRVQECRTIPRRLPRSETSHPVSRPGHCAELIDKPTDCRC